MTRLIQNLLSTPGGNKKRLRGEDGEWVTPTKPTLSTCLTATKTVHTSTQVGHGDNKNHQSSIRTFTINVDAAQKKIMIQKTPSLPKILKKKPKKEKATKAADMSASTLLKRNKGLFKNHPKTSPAHKINRKPIKMPEPTPKIRKFIDFFEKKDVANSMVTLMQKEPSKKTPEGRLPTQTIHAPSPVPPAGATENGCQMSGQLSNIQKLTSQPPQPIGDREQDHMTPYDQPGPTRNEKAPGMEKQARRQPS